MTTRFFDLCVWMAVGAILLNSHVVIAQSDPVLTWCKERNFPDLVPTCVATMRKEGPGLVQQLERERKLRESVSVAERQARAELRRRINEDLELGYTHITMKDYVEHTPPPETKVAVPAHVVSADTIVDDGRLLPFGHTVGMSFSLMGYVPQAKFRANIVLGDASREVRDAVLKCIQFSGRLSPCAMMIRGDVDRCTINYYGVDRIASCLTVEGAWRINGLVSDKDTLELKLGPLVPTLDERGSAIK